MDIAWMASRWSKGAEASIAMGGDGRDYINRPMTRPVYEAFREELLAGEKTEFKEWEASTPYFDACMPIEVVAARGAGDAALPAGRWTAAGARQAALGNAWTPEGALA